MLLGLLLNPAVIGLTALFLAIVWMLRDETDRTRPLLVMALVLNLVYGWVLSYVMGKENGLVPWKYDYVLLRLDDSLGEHAAAVAGFLQHSARVPLFILYQLMVPMMIVWFFVARSHRLSSAIVLAYIAEMVVGPLLYAVVPGCGPLYAFHARWLQPPAVNPVAIRLSGMPNAFPSLHLATALVFVLFAPTRITRAIALTFLAGTALATISTGEHYIIDLVAGLAFGCFASAAGRKRLVSSLLFAGLALAWSLSVRFAGGFLIAHPAALRSFAAITVGAVAAAVALEWKSMQPANQPAEAAATQLAQP
ncbi:MAG TPA: phosphatase PAP2 family protein [Terracidiphilus sp.]|jgi:hypothetical protein|nr:phosphatase PAP2 family protein [Terracidiphilus sp.]